MPIASGLRAIATQLPSGLPVPESHVDLAPEPIVVRRSMGRVGVHPAPICSIVSRGHEMPITSGLRDALSLDYTAGHTP